MSVIIFERAVGFLHCSNAPFFACSFVERISRSNFLQHSHRISAVVISGSATLRRF
jgi:hypothetical protein